MAFALIAAGAPIDEQDGIGRTALIFAAMSHETEIAKTLIEAGVQLNIMDGGEQSALNHARYGGRCSLDIFKLLVTAGASLDVQDKNGETEFMYFTRMGLTDVTKLMIDAGASID